jgi:cytidylate kinase-like protein
MSRHHPTMVEVLGDRSWPFPRATPREAGTGRIVIAVSRLPGARGGELARVLGQRLRLRVFDREIIQQIAESAHLSEGAVSWLDEHDRPVLRDWLVALAPDQLDSFGYRAHLTHVVSAIARLGNAVIVGRGAHLILGPGEALRVLVVASLADRIATVAAREGLSLAQAAGRVAELDRERRAFVTRHFHADPTDATAFDLVVNTSRLGVEGAAELVHQALSRMPTSEAARAAGARASPPLS